MMLQSINKKKIYFYLLTLLLFSSTFNFNIISKFKKLNLITHINILGLSEKEKDFVEKKLEIFINKNIYLINKDEIENRLKINSFLHNYSVVKVFPSKLLVNVKKTEFIGKTIIGGKYFYIGKNGKLTESEIVEKEYNLPQVFGSFKVEQFLKLQDILSTNGFKLSKIKNYYYYKNNRWDIEYHNNIILKLPSNNIEKSLKDYSSLLKVKKIVSDKLIDLRIKNKIIISDEKK